MFRLFVFIGSYVLGLFSRPQEKIVTGFSAHRPTVTASRSGFVGGPVARPQQAGGNAIGDALAALVTGSITPTSVISTATPMTTAIGVIVVALIIAPLWGMRMVKSLMRVFR